MAAARKIPLSLARSGLSALVGRVAFAGERVIIYRYGGPMAAMVPLHDLRRLESLDRDNARQTQPDSREALLERLEQAMQANIRECRQRQEEGWR